MYKQQKHLKRHIKECNKPKKIPLLDLLDPKKNNLRFLEILHLNNLKSKPNYFKKSECNKAKIKRYLESLDSQKNNIDFLKILHLNNLKFNTNYFKMPEYFKKLEVLGQTSFKENYDKLHNSAANCTLKLIDKSIKSYEALSDIYYTLPKEQRNKKPGTYRPGFPKYKKADELQIFQIYDTRLERISKTTAKVIWPKRIKELITENKFPNTELIIQVPTDLDYEVKTISKNIPESCIQKPCKYSLIRIIPKQNSFKVEVVYNKLTDISKQENLHTQRDHQYNIAKHSLAQAIEIKQGPIATQLKERLATEQNQTTKQKLKEASVLINKLKKTSLPKIFNYTLSKNKEPIQVHIKVKIETTLEIITTSLKSIPTKLKSDFKSEIASRQAYLLPKYTPGEDRQAFISKAIVFAGIDPGLINFATIATLADHKPENHQTLKELRLLDTKIEAKLFNGKAIRSQLKYLNFQLSEAQSKLKQFKPNQHTSNKIKNIYQKRENIIDNLIKQAAAGTLKYCLANHIQVLAAGYSKGWKQSPKLHKDTKTIFELIPFKRFLDYLKFKLEDHGILVQLTEESYTSQTSVLDQEQPIKSNGNKARRAKKVKRKLLLSSAGAPIKEKGTTSRRTKRGLFISNNGTRINADINAAYQMIKKVRPNIRYATSLIDTKGAFFSTSNKQHKNKKAIKPKELPQQSKVINTTNFYIHEGKITQSKLFKPEHQKFRQNYTRTFTLFRKETTNKVA